MLHGGLRTDVPSFTAHAFVFGERGELVVQFPPGSQSGQASPLLFRVCAQKERPSGGGLSRSRRRRPERSDEPVAAAGEVGQPGVSRREILYKVVLDRRIPEPELSACFKCSNNEKLAFSSADNAFYFTRYRVDYPQVLSLQSSRAPEQQSSRPSFPPHCVFGINSAGYTGACHRAIRY